MHMETTTMNMKLFETELKRIFAEHKVSTESALFQSILDEVKTLYEGVTSVKDMIITGTEKRASDAEAKATKLEEQLARNKTK